MEHPDSGIAEWAQSHLIQQQGVRLLRSGEGNDNRTVRLVEELFTSVESYLNYSAKENSSIEPDDGYFDNVFRQPLDFLLRAVDLVAPKGRNAQSRLLEKLINMFSSSKQVSNYSYRFNFFEKPFDLVFTDIANGERIDTRDYRGNLVIVCSWSARWPLPENVFDSDVQKTYTNYPNDVKVIEISSDDAELGVQATLEQRRKLEESVVDFATKHGMDWPISLDFSFTRMVQY